MAICKELCEFEFLSENGNHRIAWNLFIGAGAWSLGWSQMPIIGMETDFTKQIQTYFGHESLGQKMLKFKSQQNAIDPATNLATKVEQGIVHSFVAVS